MIVLQAPSNCQQTKNAIVSLEMPNGTLQWIFGVSVPVPLVTYDKLVYTFPNGHGDYTAFADYDDADCYRGKQGVRTYAANIRLHKVHGESVAELYEKCCKIKGKPAPFFAVMEFVKLHGGQIEPGSTLISFAHDAYQRKKTRITAIYCEPTCDRYDYLFYMEGSEPRGGETEEAVAKRMKKTNYIAVVAI